MGTYMISERDGGEGTDEDERTKRELAGAARLACCDKRAAVDGCQGEPREGPGDYCAPADPAER
jgi:hypothetical protein